VPHILKKVFVGLVDKSDTNTKLRIQIQTYQNAKNQNNAKNNTKVP